MLIETLGPIDYFSILQCYYTLEKQIVWPDGEKKQTSIQYRTGDDVWSSSIGRSKGEEISYNNINPLFKGTVIEELIDKFNLKRTRFMWVHSRSCYSMHKDSTPRIHIPLITNPDCYFIFKTIPPKYLAPGFVYKVDTRHPHTFLNCSNESRLHIVGIVEN